MCRFRFSAWIRTLYLSGGQSFSIDTGPLRSFEGDDGWNICWLNSIQLWNTENTPESRVRCARVVYT